MITRLFVTQDPIRSPLNSITLPLPVRASGWFCCAAFRIEGPARVARQKRRSLT
jgi:hypothetical protein